MPDHPHNPTSARPPTFWPGVPSNWGRWGADDQRGALNLVDAEAVRRGATAVRSGLPLALARPMAPGLPPYYANGLPAAVVHEMVIWWTSNAGGDVQAAGDQVLAQCHGLDVTHLDALCHIGHRGRGWNDRDFAGMVGSEGASACGVDALGPIATRGVLVDVARRRGVDHLPHGTAVGPEDLEDAELLPGDALLVRTGRWRAGDDGRGPQERYGRLSGLHPDALRVVAERDVAVLGTDGPADTFPVPTDACRLPIHALSLVHLGVPLLHCLDLDELAERLHAEGRTAFQLTVAPLPVPGATGSPVAPIALL